MLSFRRKYLDSNLNSCSFAGKVLDVGGKKNNKRGTFSPPMDDVVSWHYANIDASTNPDFLVNAQTLPVDDKSYDRVVFCEVLEHVENPHLVLSECSRVLKDDGVFIASVPFLYPFHADPYDYHRWTHVGLEKALLANGFSKVEIFFMGGLTAVLFDITLAVSKRISRRRGRVLRALLKVLRPLCNFMDSKDITTSQWATTGYFIKASKV